MGELTAIYLHRVYSDFSSMKRTKSSGQAHNSFKYFCESVSGDSLAQQEQEQ